jgi:CheY-like chemotaxis protein
MIRVFIADDEAPARERLRELLQDIAAEVPNVVAGEAKNGIEALERLPASAAQVLLLDIRMPGMDGFETATRLRSSHPGVVLILVTAEQAPFLPGGMSASGADELVGKQDLAPALLRRLWRDHGPG